MFKWSPNAIQWPVKLIRNDRYMTVLVSLQICLEQDLNRIGSNLSLYPHMQCTNIGKISERLDSKRISEMFFSKTLLYRCTWRLCVNNKRGLSTSTRNLSSSSTSMFTGMRRIRVKTKERNRCMSRWIVFKVFVVCWNSSLVTTNSDYFPNLRLPFLCSSCSRSSLSFLDCDFHPCWV